MTTLRCQISCNHHDVVILQSFCLRLYDAANGINIKIKCTQVQISPHFLICTGLEVSLYLCTK